MNAALTDPGVRARIAEVGGSPLIYTTTQLDALIRENNKRGRDDDDVDVPELEEAAVGSDVGLTSSHDEDDARCA